MTDPIADMLTRIRNALAVHRSSVTMPYSKLKYNLAFILKQEGYISNVSMSKETGKALLVLNLKYAMDGTATIHALRRISKPGRRVYSGKKTLPYVLNNFGIAIISTSKGLMTNKQARQQNFGGEVICEIY